MTTINKTQLDALNGTASTTNNKASAAGIEDRFLKLLVTQLKNQDPLNPMDNAQTTSQMAQISTVTGIEKLNASIASLSQAFGASQSLQAATLVGRDVLVAGKNLKLEAGNAAGAIDLGADADKVVVKVRDSGGRVLQEVDLGKHSAGLMSFSWDGAQDDGGTAPSGEYTFEVEATKAGEAVSSARYTQGKVKSVTFGGAQASLQVAGVGDVFMADIRQIM